MNKIEINVDPNTYNFLLDHAKQLDLPLSLLCQRILTSHALAFSESLPDELKYLPHTKEAVSEDVNKFKEILSAYPMTQIDIASYLKISQTSVSLYLGGKKENSLIKKNLSQFGLDKFLLQVFKHKYLSLAENEIRLDFNPSFSNFSYKESSSYEVLKNWPQWKKILFSYIVMLDYIDVEGESITKEEIFEAIDNTSEDCEYKLIQAEKEGLDSYISTLHQCFDINLLSSQTLGASPF